AVHPPVFNPRQSSLIDRNRAQRLSPRSQHTRVSNGNRCEDCHRHGQPPRRNPMRSKGPPRHYRRNNRQQQAHIAKADMQPLQSARFQLSRGSSSSIFFRRIIGCNRHFFFTGYGDWHHNLSRLLYRVPSSAYADKTGSGNEGLLSASFRYTGNARHNGIRGANNMYPEIMMIPMREELTSAGVQETRTAEEVDQALAKPGTTMVVVNSICGCAAGKMRPGLRMSLQHPTVPDQKITVFAGQDREATDKVRSHLAGHPPSSPAIAIFRDGELVFLMQRSVIESASAPQIAQYLTQAYDEICAKPTPISQ